MQNRVICKITLIYGNVSIPIFSPCPLSLQNSDRNPGYKIAVILVAHSRAPITRPTLYDAHGTATMTSGESGHCSTLRPSKTITYIQLFYAPYASKITIRKFREIEKSFCLILKTSNVLMQCNFNHFKLHYNRTSAVNIIRSGKII